MSIYEILRMYAGPDLQGAACATSDLPPDYWFPADASDVPNMHKAQQVCRSCPCIKECLTLALTTGEEYGVWGGMTTRQRKRLVRGMRRLDGR